MVENRVRGTRWELGPLQDLGAVQTSDGRVITADFVIRRPIREGEHDATTTPRSRTSHAKPARHDQRDAHSGRLASPAFRSTSGKSVKVDFDDRRGDLDKFKELLARRSTGSSRRRKGVPRWKKIRSRHGCDAATAKHAAAPGQDLLFCGTRLRKAFEADPNKFLDRLQGADVSSTRLNGGPSAARAGHVGSPTCDPAGGQPTIAHKRPRRAHRARGKNSDRPGRRNLFVSLEANGNCCCGWTEKGRMPFDNTLWSTSGQADACCGSRAPDVACVWALCDRKQRALQIYGRSIWFKDLNRRSSRDAVRLPQAMLAVDRVLPPPDGSRPDLYERYLTPKDAAPVMTRRQRNTGRSY